MNILIVEDDSGQAKLIAERLTEELAERQKQCEIDQIATESEFLRRFDAIAQKPPDLIVMDVMLRWCDVSEHISAPPPDCEDFSRAGVRCCKLLRADSRTRLIPVVVLTVLDNNGLGLPERCSHVQKTSDFAQLVFEALRHL